MCDQTCAHTARLPSFPVIALLEALEQQRYIAPPWHLMCNTCLIFSIKANMLRHVLNKPPMSKNKTGRKGHKSRVYDGRDRYMVHVSKKRTQYIPRPRFGPGQPWNGNEKSYTPRSLGNPKSGLADRRDPKPGVYAQKTTNRIHQDPIFEHFGTWQTQNLVYMTEKNCTTAPTSPNFRMLQGLAETVCTKPPWSYTPRPAPCIHQERTKMLVYTKKGPYTPRMPDISRRDPSVRMSKHTRAKTAALGLRRRLRCQGNSNPARESELPHRKHIFKEVSWSPHHPA